MIVVVFGLPGTGKTTVANVIAKKLKAKVVSTDFIRKQLFPRPTYQNWEKGLVYKVMYLIADILSQSGVNCIMDAVFTKEIHRKIAKDIAERNKVPICFIECRCDESVIKERIEKRFKIKSLSDANFAIYLKLKKEWQPTKMKHFVVDTTEDSEQAAKLLLKHFKFV